MIKLKQNTFIILTIVLLVVGMIVGIMAVNTVTKTSSSASEGATFTSEEYQGSVENPGNQGYYAGYGDCVSKCKAAGHSALTCAIVCIFE